MTGTVLAQVRPSDTSNTQVYSPASGITAEITRVLVVNTSNGNDTFSIFLHRTGTTYDESTALFWDETLNSDTTREIEGSWWLDDPDGNLAVNAGTGNAVTFTFFGIEHQR